MQQQPQNHSHIILATVLSIFILLAWSFFYEQPKLKKQEINKKNNSIVIKNDSANTLDMVNNISQNTTSSLDLNQSSTFVTREQYFSYDQAKNNRVTISNNNLHGSISLQGAIFDDLTLAHYFTKLNSKKEVVLFSPASTVNRYFSDFGWINKGDNQIILPNLNTLWQANSNILSPQQNLILTWQNGQGIDFIITIAIDDQYMFDIKQEVINNTSRNIKLANYGRISRFFTAQSQANFILHEGQIGVFNGILEEFSYQKMIKEKQKNFSNNSTGSWLGITDKYWLSTIVPSPDISYQANFTHQIINQQNQYSTIFTSDPIEILANSKISINHHLFAGAKNVKLLDNYKNQYNLKLFDRAIDFGWFYFLTKPFFFIIDFLYKFLGNFGLAILTITVLVKLALFPLASKSYAAMAKIRKLQPKIEALRKKTTDKIALNREIMDLYKKEKINPASGCLPIFIQIPIFFALYKVFFVTLDMRHATFYGWIKDLSAPDPTSIFNLFGLLPFEVSSIFMIGVWPILMGITMFLQQKVSPATTDPIQAKVLKLMPFVLTVLLASFPSGLVIYWTWSNTLSILQQLYINHKYKN
jgi:YidC/Oxa1 family membrane protein insertase